MVGGDAGIDRALDELYGASPAEFTEKRKALAKALAAAGDKAAASRVSAQRKPTQIAWVLNQLARKHPDEIAELVDVGRLLARAQRKALRGEKGTDLRDAIAEQRRIVGDLTGKAAALMRDLGVTVQGHLDEVSGALHAALVDPTVGATLEEGRLDRLPAPATGFPGASLAPEAEAVAERDEEPEEEPKKEREEPKRPRHPEHSAKKAKAEAAAQRAHAREVARAEAKARAEEKARAEARAAEAEAVQTARIAEEAEREADGAAANAKKLTDAARALDAEAKRLAAESAARAREAKAAHRDADRARADAARALAEAKTARAAATRAARARA